MAGIDFRIQRYTFPALAAAALFGASMPFDALGNTRLRPSSAALPLAEGWAHMGADRAPRAFETGTK